MPAEQRLLPPVAAGAPPRLRIYCASVGAPRNVCARKVQLLQALKALVYSSTTKSREPVELDGRARHGIRLTTASCSCADLQRAKRR